MRRIISVLIAASIILSLTVPAFAAEPDEPQFGTIKVEYSDALGSIEALEVMVQDGYVYAEMRAFTSRLGLDCKQDGSLVSIFNSRVKLWSSDAPALALHYRVGSKEVSYNPLFGMEIAYTAPCPCVENERGVWLPLSYTLTLLGGSRNIAGDVLVVQMPSNNVLSIAATIRNNKSLLSFDWEDDFGYSEATSNITDGAARVVTLFSGLLKFDGSAWSSFVDWNAFDKKFGKTLAAMFCTNTADELKASIEEVELLVDVFADDGALGSMLRNEQIRIDSDVDAWKKICKEHLEKLKAGSGTLPQYNLAYQQYERAMNEQDLFSAVGADDLIHIQDELSTATNVLDKASKIGYAVSYLSEFQQRDAFQAAVLTNYFATRKDTDEISDATAKAMADYASSNIVEYTASKFCQEHLLEILVDETGLDALMGAPANILLIAWDIMSETVPFYKDGLKDVDKREISNYAQQLQADALANVEALMVKLSTHADSLSAEDCVQLSEYCYIYLKACYIARTSAIESLENISKDAREKIQSKIDAETDVNKTIAQCLSVLSRAESGNGCYILGFLPKNNDEYLKVYSDESLLQIFNAQPGSNGLVSDIYFDYIIDDRYNQQYCYHIPWFALEGNRFEHLNSEIYDKLYATLEENVYANIRMDASINVTNISYGCGIKNGYVSLIISTKFDWGGAKYYDVFNVNIHDGSRIPTQDLLSAYGLSDADYRELVKKSLKEKYESTFSEAYEANKSNDNFVKFYQQQRNATISDQNIDAVIPYIDVNGDLCCIARIYSMAGADYYHHLINLTGTDEPTPIECSVDHSAEKAEPSGDALQYFIENCDRQYFTEADVKDFDHQMCVYARNAVFAKSGRIFQSQELQEYFAKYSWYVPRVEPENFSNDMLNTIQRSNVDLILDREEELEIEGLMNSLDGEEGIYTRYLHNGGYEEILGSDYDKNALEISTCLVDLDYDGTDELFLSIETGDRGIRGRAAHTLLLDIKGDKVFIAAETYFGGGSMGGDHLVIKYDRDTKKHVLALDGHIRAGVEEYTTYLDIYSTPGFNVGLELVERYYSMYYDWYRDVIDKIRSETTLYYMDEYDFRCYQIDEQYVTKEAFDNAWARYEDAREGFQLKPATYVKPIA